MPTHLVHRILLHLYRLEPSLRNTALVVLLSSCVLAQTPSTGAITGVALGPSGAALPGVSIQLNNKNGVGVKFGATDKNGRFGFLLLTPGDYELRVSKPGFCPVPVLSVHVAVAETAHLKLHFKLLMRLEETEVFSNAQMVQLNTAVLGRTVGKTTVAAMPLVTRNFSQLTALSPGVGAGVYNAGELGTGGTALSQIGKSNDGIFAHGARSYDNNWQLDGISVSDVLGSGAASGGIPIPNPDALEEFNVQTGLYDAAFGRGAGANVSIISKKGENDFHASVFEFLRNNVFNANEYFLKQTGQPRPDLKQNQFGLTIGGPIRKDKLTFFASYQGTRQINGLSAGQSRIACSASLSEPALTNDRSPTAIGQLFGGMKGALGGIAVRPDGSNINPAALALLNFKLPDGSFLIPTPQTVDASKPFARQGFSVFSQPCQFNEDQFLVNLDLARSQDSHFAARFFTADDNQTVTFPGNGFNAVGNTRGFASPGGSRYVVFSVAHTYAARSTLLNQARLGFVRTSTTTDAKAPFKWSDIGVSEGEMNRNNELPSFDIVGSLSMTSAFARTYSQKSFVLSDDLSVLKGAHALKIGGSLTRSEVDVTFMGARSSLRFLSWPDFLLGLDATANGTSTVSNVYTSSDFFGLLDRKYDVWEGSAYVEDDYHIRPSLTVNLGVRYERLGQFGDKLGRNSSFDISKANANPPASGSLDGYIVGANFAGSLPPGVRRVNNTFATLGEGQNVIAPRLGITWQILPRTSRLALRAGYGTYYSRPTAQAATVSILGAPFGVTRLSTGLSNAAATFQMPFAQPFPTPSTFPLFTPYSPSTSLPINSISPAFRPAAVQQFSLDTQAEVFQGWLLDIGYVGTHGTHLQRFRSLNQALSATPEHPINGVTTNSLSNIGLRVPIPGIGPDSLRKMESGGESWYNGLEVSFTKRLSGGFQFLASYTFSKTLDTDGADVNGTSAGNVLTLGDQNSPRQRWGRTSFNRTHRFILSGIWFLPSPPTGALRLIFGGWSSSAVATIQSGSALTIAQTNSTNVFGISEDRAQLTGACSKSQLVNGGPVQSKLNSYFDSSCFTTSPVTGGDGIGTAFGNSATGIVDGPGQANLDLALSKTVRLSWPVEKSKLQFRAEFYNVMNHPQFANPDTNFSSATFGVISSTAVSARVGQLAVKYAF